MKAGELRRALDDLKLHWQAGRISWAEFEAARVLLEAQVDTFVSEVRDEQAFGPLVMGDKTAPYPSFQPEVLSRELGTQGHALTPYQPPMSTSQHTLTTPPSNRPARGPTSSQYNRKSSPAPASRATLPPQHNQHDTPLSQNQFAESKSTAQAKGLGDLVEALKALSQLHQLGVLSEQEYQDTKSPILQQIRIVLHRTLAQRSNTSYPELLTKLLSR